MTTTKNPAETVTNEHDTPLAGLTDADAAPVETAQESVELTAEYGLSPREFALVQAVQLYARVNATPGIVVAAAQRFESYLAGPAGE